MDNDDEDDGDDDEEEEEDDDDDDEKNNPCFVNWNVKQPTRDPTAVVTVVHGHFSRNERRVAGSAAEADDISGGTGRQRKTTIVP
jgi:hypothetical protein